MSKPIITPLPEGAIVESCKKCRERLSPNRMNKNNPKDLVLAEQAAAADTNDKQTTKCSWCSDCGAFRGYITTLLFTHDGLPYAGNI